MLGTYMVPRERQREEIASDYYYGGMVVERTGQLHPALYYGGLLKAAHRAGARLCANATPRRIERKTRRTASRVLTNKGPIEAREVVIATNGYTGDVTPTLKRRLVPVASHIIATEELPEDLAKSLIPKGRAVSDTKRVLCYYRPLARRQARDLRRPRPLHPGAARGQRAGAAPLHDRPLAAAQGHPRSPTPGPATSPSPSTSCRTWAWSRACTTCWPATARRRDDDLSRHQTARKIAGGSNDADQRLRRPRVPRPCPSTAAIRGSCRWSAPGTARATGSIARRREPS